MARRRRRAFTLIEVMVVILIVLALGGLVLFNMMGTRDKADADLGRIQLDQVKQALKMFKLTFGRYPTDEEGLKALWDKEALTEDDDKKKWQKLLDEPMPKDRWGTEWGYRQVGEHGDEAMYDLWSFGPDKQEGTGDDIVSWKADADPGSPSGSPSGSGATGPTGGGAPRPPSGG